MSKAPAPVDEQLESLNDLAEAVNYNRWIFELTKPYLGDRIIDIGCGTGNFIPYLGGRKILGLDVNPAYLKVAKKRFQKKKNVQFAVVDLGKSLSKFKAFRPDTIICVNVLEHVRHDNRLLEECKALLPPGGQLILFTPALPLIFGEMDRTYGHFRRYTKSELRRMLHKRGFTVERCEYLNISGVFGWWFNGVVLKRKRIPRAQMLAFDRVFKIVLSLEKMLPKVLGLSVFAVARK